jgi:hypothetical protein
VPGGDPVGGIGVLWNLDVWPRQLLAKSYRAGSGAQDGLAEAGDPIGKLLRRADERLPDPAALPGERRGEDFAAARVEGRQPDRAAKVLEPAPERLESSDPTHLDASAEPQRTSRRDPYPQAREGARADPDRDGADLLPAARRRCCPLDLAEQRRRVPGASLLGEPEQ